MILLFSLPGHDDRMIARVFIKNGTFMKRKIWAQNDIDTLITMFPHNYTEDVCKVLNRSYGSVSGKALLLGLKKSRIFKEIEISKTADRLRVIGTTSRWDKGHVPHNKGKKMPDQIYQKCAPTMFKKGQTPHNTNYDGHERISKDGYIEVRVRLGKYMLKHRHIWEQTNGPIPKGMILTFRDGDKKNVKLENLELITRQEGMARNTIQRFPPELVSTIKLVNKLNKQIHEKQN